jgi:hypothetical protein
MKCFYSGSLWGLVLILFSITENVAETLPADSSLYFYDKTFRLIHKNEFDSALLSIRQAYAYGLSDDSLLYAWAEIYNSKGALDTAIALSLSIKSKPGHPLYYSVLKQRYFIYTLTNQKEKAYRVFDTLSRRKEYRMEQLVPEMSYFFRGGIQQNSTKEAEILPSYLDYAYPQSEPARGNGAGGFNLKWNIPLRKVMGLEITTGVDVYQYNPPDNFRLKHALDSSYSEEYAQCRYYILSGMIAGTYKLSRLDEYADFIYFKHSIVSSYKHKVYLDYVTYIKELFFSGVAGYSYDVGRRVHNWNILLFGNRDWTSRRSNSLSISVNGVHMKNDTLYDFDFCRKMYIEGNTFYENSKYVTPVPMTTALRNAPRQDTVFISTILPRSYINTKLNISQNFSFNHGLDFSLFIEGATSWFADFYKWVDPVVVNTNTDDASLLYDRLDSTWHFSKSLKPLIIDTLSHPYALVHKKKRVDQTITANVSFKKDIKKIASIGLNGSVSRTFSNMNGDDAVVDVPVWAYSVMLSTTIKFNPSGRLH